MARRVGFYLVKFEFWDRKSSGGSFQGNSKRWSDVVKRVVKVLERIDEKFQGVYKRAKRKTQLITIAFANSGMKWRAHSSTFMR